MISHTQDMMNIITTVTSRPPKNIITVLKQDFKIKLVKISCN